MYGWAKVAEVELKFTTAGAVPCFSAGRDSRVTRKVPIRLTRSTDSKSASVVSAKWAERRMPATLTSVSRPPNSSHARATPVFTESSLPTSMTTVCSRVPVSPALVPVSARPASLMSAATTAPPSARMRNTQAWPIPDPPPVTSTRRPV